MAYEKKDKFAGGHTKFNYRKAYESGRGTKDLEPMRMKKRGLIGALQRLLPGGASGMELIRDPETGEILYGDQWDEYPASRRPAMVQDIRNDLEAEIELQMRDKAGYRYSDREPTLFESFVDEIGKGIQRRKTRRKERKRAKYESKAQEHSVQSALFGEAWESGEFKGMSKLEAWKQFSKPSSKRKRGKSNKKASRKYDNNTYTEGE